MNMIPVRDQPVLDQMFSEYAQADEVLKREKKEEEGDGGGSPKKWGEG